MLAADPVLPVWMQVAVAVATVSAAMAAAVSAYASWRSAKASVATGQDAMEALALGIRPRLEASPPQPPMPGQTPGQAARLGVIVTNPSDFDAADIEVEVRRRDGQVLNTRAGRLPASHGQRAQEFRDAISADAGDPPTSVFDPWGMSVIERVVVRYSDHRDIARYEHRYLYTWNEGPDVTGGGRSVEVERIR